MQGEFNGDREYTGLATFIDQEAAEYRKRKGVSDSTHPKDEIVDPPSVPGPNGQISGPLVDTVNKVGNPDAAPAPAPQKPDAQQKVVPTPALSPPSPAAQLDAQPAPAPPPAAPATPAKEQEGVRGPNPHGLVLKFGKDEAVKDVAALKHFLSKKAGPDSTFVKCESLKNDVLLRVTVILICFIPSLCFMVSTLQSYGLCVCSSRSGATRSNKRR